MLDYKCVMGKSPTDPIAARSWRLHYLAFMGEARSHNAQCSHCDEDQSAHCHLRLGGAPVSVTIARRGNLQVNVGLQMRNGQISDRSDRGAVMAPALSRLHLAQIGL